MSAIPSIGDHPDSRNASKTLPGLARSYVRHLSLAELRCERRYGRPCLLDLLDQADLRLPEGIILGEDAHLEFMQQSGLLEDLRARPLQEEYDAIARARRLRLLYRSSPIEGELNRQICEALLELGAPRVTVVCEGSTRKGLGSIPEVKDAVREAWLSPEGLDQQVEAASHGEEIPTWQVLILAEGAR